MTLTIDLTEAQERRLSDLALREGRTPAEIASEFLDEWLSADESSIESWLQGSVVATLGKVAAGNGEFFSVEEARDYLATHRQST